MEPVGLHARTPGTAETTNSPPSLVPPVARTGTLGETLASEQLQASDADGDGLWFEAVDLPDGLSLSPTGVLAGSFDSAGDYAVTLRVDDGQSLAESSFTWRVIDPTDPNAGTTDGSDGSTTAATPSGEGTRRSGGGAASAQMLLILLLLLLRPQCLERIARQEPSPCRTRATFARIFWSPSVIDRTSNRVLSALAARSSQSTSSAATAAVTASDTPLPQLRTNGDWPSKFASHLLCKRAGIAPIIDIVGIAKRTEGFDDDLLVESPFREFSRQLRRRVITTAEKTD